MNGLMKMSSISEESDGCYFKECTLHHVVVVQ